MKIKVYHLSGAGNLFTVIDNSDGLLDTSSISEFTPLLNQANETNKFKSEGLMLLEKSKNYDFKCEFFNPDGSTGMMCGNGGRAIVKFAKEMNRIKASKKTIKFEMANDIYEAEFNGENIKLYLPKPSVIKENFIIEIEGKNIKGTYVDIGSDHFIVEINKLNITDFNSFDINKFGKMIRHNSIFKNGSNANFIQINKDEKGDFVKLRTYERGVEAETGACGTGAVSTAIHCVLNKKNKFPVRILPTSNQELIIDYTGNFPDDIKNMILEGPAEILDTQEIELPIL